MHDTAYRIGTRFLQTYGAIPKGTIVEIGALDVNGSLRCESLADVKYVGVDLEAGPSVDVVIAAGADLPFDDGCVDAVIASSVFEHDATFWLTFREMSRITRAGGYIYVNTPSNGVVHRYPLDCWRFYPDAGRALELTSRRDGYEVTLIESFVAERMSDNWNDFVAVFQRVGGRERCAHRLHNHFPCRNVFDVGEAELGRPEGLSEDMRLIAAARDELAGKSASLGNFERALHQIALDLSKASQQRQAMHAAIEHLNSRIEERLGEIASINLKVGSDVEATRTLVSQQQGPMGALANEAARRLDKIEKFLERNEQVRIHDQAHLNMKLENERERLLETISTDRENRLRLDKIEDFLKQNEQARIRDHLKIEAKIDREKFLESALSSELRRNWVDRLFGRARRNAGP